MRLTREEKQQVVDMYWDDFYCFNICEWFEYNHPRYAKRILRRMLKSYGYTIKDWKKLQKDADKFDCDASEEIESITLDSMNVMLDECHIDTDKTYVESY